MRIRRGPPAAIFFYLQHAHAVHPIQAGVNSRSGDGRPRSLSTSTPTRPRSPVSAFATPRVTANAIEELGTKGYAVVPNFLSPDLVSALNRDISNLRSKSAFSVARIGQDATNKLNTEIRVAETCFIGRSKLSHIPDTSREQLYDALESVRDDLTANSALDEHQNGDLIKAAPALDSGLSELLYAFYPSGGFYRRHRDAIAGSASVLRCYSLLLYLNEDWKEEDGGKLRMHFDGGGDFSPDGADPNFVDVSNNSLVTGFCTRVQYDA